MAASLEAEKVAAIMEIVIVAAVVAAIQAAEGQVAMVKTAVVVWKGMYGVLDCAQLRDTS